MFKCEPYLWKENKPTYNPSYLKELELELQIKFPVEFLNFMELYFGDKPIYSSFEVGKGHCSIAHFLHCQNLVNDDFEIYSISDQREEIDEFLSDKIVPFAITFDSNLIAFDFRHKITEPEVIFIISSQLEDGDKAIRHISSNFHEFLAILEKMKTNFDLAK